MELSMNIGNLTGRFDLARCAEIYKAAGFTAVDYSLGELEREGTSLSSEDYRSAAEAARKTLNDAGLRVNQTHAPFHFTKWDDPVVFEEVIFPKFIRSIEISAILGADVTVIHPLHHWVYRGHEEEIFEKNMAFYRRLIPYCREFGVKVGVENMWQKDALRRFNSFDVCSTIEEFVRYIDTLDSEYMVACLDVGHVGLPLQDEEAHDFVRALGHDRLKSLHIHDNDYTGDQHLLPFLGKMNWTELTRALGEIDYTGDFTYEVNGKFLTNVSEGFIQTAANYMGDVGKFLVNEIEQNRPAK